MKHVPSFIHIHNNTGLVPSNGGNFMDTVQAKECGDTTLADREWIYNQTSQSLKHAASGLCLDAGTQISLDCWSASSPNSAHPMCNPSLSAEARAKDFVRTQCCGMASVVHGPGFCRYPIANQPPERAVEGCAQRQCVREGYWAASVVPFKLGVVGSRAAACLLEAV